LARIVEEASRRAKQELGLDPDATMKADPQFLEYLKVRDRITAQEVLPEHGGPWQESGSEQVPQTGWGTYV
jgi:hypothetical protein